MKPNRHLMATILKVVCALCAGVALMSGCASTGRGKEAKPQIESPSPLDGPSASLRQTSASTPEPRKQPAVATSLTSAKPVAQKVVSKAVDNRSTQQVAAVKPGLDRILADALRNMNWQRVVSVVGGILAMALFWGLAFWLGRMPRRGRGASPQRVVRQTAQQAGGLAPSQAAYRAA